MRSNENTDAELVAAARNGSQDACYDLVRRFERPIYSLLLRMVGEASIAEELAQEAFVKAFGALERYDPRRKLSSWLFKIAHNTAIDYLRRHRLATVPLESPDEAAPNLAALLADPRAEAPSDRIERADRIRLLEAALAMLRPEYREIVLLRYQQEMSYQELTEVMQLPIGTVKTHLHRARQELAGHAMQVGLGPERKFSKPA